MPETKIFIVLSKAGPNRDLSKGSREQAYWDDHAAFIDALVENTFIMMGGPITDEGGAMLIVRADSREEVEARLQADPWTASGHLYTTQISPWTLRLGSLP